MKPPAIVRFDPFTARPQTVEKPRPETASLCRQILAIPAATFGVMAGQSNPERATAIRAEFAAWAAAHARHADWRMAWKDYAGSISSVKKPALISTAPTALEALRAI